MLYQLYINIRHGERCIFSLFKFQIMVLKTHKFSEIDILSSNNSKIDVPSTRASWDYNLKRNSSFKRI